MIDIVHRTQTVTGVIGGEAGDVTAAVRPVFWEWEKLVSVDETLTQTTHCYTQRFNVFILMCCVSQEDNSVTFHYQQLDIYKYITISISTTGRIHEPRQDRLFLIDKVKLSKGWDCSMSSYCSTHHDVLYAQSFDSFCVCLFDVVFKYWLQNLNVQDLFDSFLPF